MHEITSYFITQNDINLLTLSLVLKVETSDLASFSLFVFFSASTANYVQNRKMTIMLSCKLQVLKAYKPVSLKGHENHLIKIQKVDMIYN